MQSFDVSAFIKTHGQKLEYGLLVAVIFTAGFQSGRLTSPYSTSTPIVFQESDGTTSIANQSNQGDTKQLEALQQAGQELQKPISTSTPQVAGTTASQAQGQFVASVNSNLFHAPDCPSVSRIKPANQVWFNSVQEAQAAGYQPSKCTLEKIQ